MKEYILVIIAIGVLISILGCASTRKTTTTQTTVQYSNQEGAQAEQQATGVASDEPSKTVVAKSTTTTSTTETKPKHTGIIGGLFHIIGSVIAFPFIVIGGLLRMIF